MKKIFYCATIIILITNFAFSQEFTPKETFLTIYQNNYANVQQEIEFNANNTPTQITFTLPSSNIVTTSIFLLFNGEILEQTFKQFPEQKELWFENAIGKDVTLVSPNGQSYKGKLMHFSDDEIIINSEDKKSFIIKDFEGYTIIFNDHPFQTQDKKKVAWLLKPNKLGKNNGTLVYQTSGINWKGKYIAYIDEEKERLNLYGWATIVNNSGIDFENANLKIIEGELKISRIQAYNLPESATFELKSQIMRGLEFELEKELFDYFQYVYPQKISLKNGETKLLNLFSAENVPYKKVYTYNLYAYPPIGQKEKVSVQILFANNKQNNLGMLIPKGQIDIYTKSKSTIDFLGQDDINTIPAGDEAKIELGKVSDLAVVVKKAENIKLSEDLTERRFKVICQNFKNKNATIEINFTETAFFELIQSNIKPKVKESNKLVFEVPVNANSTSELSFIIQTKQ